MNITTLATVLQPYGGAGRAPVIIVGQTFRQALVAMLQTVPGLPQIVGQAIYPGALPQTHDVWRDGPALVYRVAGYPRGNQLAGGDDFTATADVSFYAVAADEAHADAITLAIYSDMDGTLNDDTWGNGTVVIMSANQDDEEDLPEPPPPGTDRWLYQVASMYTIKHRLTTPPGTARRI